MEKGVYFIGNLEYGYVKIGQSENVSRRFSQIQSCCPIELTVFDVLGKDDFSETEVHSFFKEHRIHGEWFKINIDLRKLLKNKIDLYKVCDNYKKSKSVVDCYYS